MALLFKTVSTVTRHTISSMKIKNNKQIEIINGDKRLMRIFQTQHAGIIIVGK
jgi:hypothetical protein